MGRKRKRGGRKSHKLPLTIAFPVGIWGYNIAKAYPHTDLMAYESVAIGPGGKFDGGKAKDIAVPIIVGVLAHITLGRYINRYVPKWSPVNF